MKSTAAKLLLSALVLASAWALLNGDSFRAKASAAPSPAAKSGELPPYLSPEELNNIHVFEKASPSVVFISSEAVRYNLFSMDIHNMPQGAGTGFIWDREGHVVTNYHVIAAADRVVVKLISQRLCTARLVGVAPDKDLAVLKIDAPAEELVPIPVAGDDNLVVGQKVLAIGNPFGLDHTLTVGVISALEREIESPPPYRRRISGVIQTDAAINPGNSGGPLLNSIGQLIGVNAQIASPSGASSGIGFAVPVRTVRKIVPQLVKSGQVKKIGLGVQCLPDYMRRRLGLNLGVVIWRVSQGSGAEKAGLKGLSSNYYGEVVLGDVILSIDGREMNSADDLLDVFENRSAGDSVKLEILRRNKKVETTAQLMELESQ